MTNLLRAFVFHVVISLLALAVPAALAADPQPPKSYKQCENCHSYQNGAAHGIGPNLRGVFARKVGTAKGYAYSSQAKRAGFTWTEDRLRAMIKDPRSYKKHLRKASHGWRPSAAKTLEREVIPFLKAISPAKAAK